MTIYYYTIYIAVYVYNCIVYIYCMKINILSYNIGRQKHDTSSSQWVWESGFFFSLFIYIVKETTSQKSHCWFPRDTLMGLIIY